MKMKQKKTLKKKEEWKTFAKKRRNFLVSVVVDVLRKIYQNKNKLKRKNKKKTTSCSLYVNHKFTF